MKIQKSDRINFTVNGKLQLVDSNYSFSYTLNDYLRNVLFLTGTKNRCSDGGCGCCVINGRVYDQKLRQYKDSLINTCLFPLYNCDKWEFTTIEGLKGKQLSEPHVIQKRLADYNGSQCGFCSPGMVMNMYNLLLNNPKPNKQLIENSFDSNLCRCTGYRPILDAMKSFALDENPIDIEELNTLRCLQPINGSSIQHTCQQMANIQVTGSDGIKTLMNNGKLWIIPSSLNELYGLLEQYRHKSYKIVSGNTGAGIFKDKQAHDVIISLQQLNELNHLDHTHQNTLKIGSRVTLTKLGEIFQDASKKQGFEYLSVFVSHLNKVANRSIRDVATWSGNLAIKKLHASYVSDIVLCFELANVKLNILDEDRTQGADRLVQLSLQEYLDLSINGPNRVPFIHSVEFPSYDSNRVLFKTYKIMPRSQSSSGCLLAGYRFHLDRESYQLSSQDKSAILYCGINSKFLHAVKTEEHLNGKNLLKDESVLQTTYEVLSNELEPISDHQMYSGEYRKSLAISTLYKFIVELMHDHVNDKYKSASESVHDQRAVSHGEQNFQQIQSKFPLTKAIPKLNAYNQTSGKVKYTFDTIIRQELIGEFIQSTIANGQIDSIDCSDALQMPGVVRILLAKDIPGRNCLNQGNPDEPLFAHDQISFAGQPIGLVIAQTVEQAKLAAEAVKIVYKNVQKPILTIKEAIEQQSFHAESPFSRIVYGDAKSAIQNAPKRLKGGFSFGTQAHFFMEPMIAVCSKTEDGYRLDCTTQWIDLLQCVVKNVMGIKAASRLDIEVRQLGGAFGGKATRSSIVGGAAALGTMLTDMPVKVCMDFKQTMEVIGKRCPWYIEYEVGFDENGKLLGVDFMWYVDEGYLPDGTILFQLEELYPFFENTYSCKNWNIRSLCVKTNTPANTTIRAPCILSTLSAAEILLDHIANDLHANPLAVRITNLYKKGEVTPYGYPLTYFNIPAIIDQLLVSSDYLNRVSQVEEFNSKNRWKKKGIYLTPLKYSALPRLGFYNALISVYNIDGSVAISHGGIEMGQGIHTKVAQVAAYVLDIDIDLISIKSTNNLVNPNGMFTSASITSELCAEATLECCKILLKNLEPVRKLMPDGYIWQELIAKAYSMHVDLCARYWLYPGPDQILPQYDAYGAACSEVLVDVLTGEMEIMRSDVTYDCGESLNGLVDIGQTEGAFVFGLGFWFYEQFAYNKTTGHPYASTHYYKIPSSKDIPADFRVTLLKDNPNEANKLRTKFVGEPPLILAVSVALAVKNAIRSARNECGNYDEFEINAPLTVEQIQKLSTVKNDDLKIL